MRKMAVYGNRALTQEVKGIPRGRGAQQAPQGAGRTVSKKTKTQQKMELMYSTMWKRAASRDAYNFVGMSRIVAKKHKYKHPSEEK